MNAELREAFWALTRECLVRFHHLPEPEAAAIVGGYVRRLEQAPPGISPDIVFHAEPFTIACDLAGHQIDDPAVLEEYFRLADRHLGEPIDPSLIRPYGAGFLPSV